MRGKTLKASPLGEAQHVEKPPSAREVPRRGGGREPCHSPKYFGQPHSSLPHRLRAEPPHRGGQGVNAPFSTVCATAVAYLCLLFYTPGVRHRKWQNEKGFWLLVKNHRALFSVNSCCCNFIFDFLLCSLRDLLTAKVTALAAIAYRNFPKYCMPL